MLAGYRPSPIDIVSHAPTVLVGVRPAGREHHREGVRRLPRLHHEVGWVSDPGHAWLRVPHSELARVGYAPSQYSYRDQEYGYLEEDCDAAAFLMLAGFDLEPGSGLIIPELKRIERGEWAGRRKATFPPSEQWRAVLTATAAAPVAVSPDLAPSFFALLDAPPVGVLDAPAALAAVARCPECGRRFDLTTASDAADWSAGHDCE